MAFELTTYKLGTLTLKPLAPENALPLGEAMAAMPPWSVYGRSAEQLAGLFLSEVPSVRRFEILAGDELAGMAAIQHPFLHGPYLQLLAVLPRFT